MDLTQLMTDATSEDRLGPSTVDVDGIVAAEKRSASRRRIGAASAATVLAVGLVVGTPAALRQFARSPQVTAGAGEVAAVGPTRPTVLTPEDQARQAAQVLAQQIPGVRNIRLETAPRTDQVGGYGVIGDYWADDRHLATIVLSARQGTPGNSGNPCTIEPGDQPGRQGAPAPDDRCTRVSQSDATVVWIWRKGHSPDRFWTTPRTKEWEFTQVRTDGAHVSVLVTSSIGEPAAGGSLIEAASRWDIPDSALLAVITSPQVAPVPK